MDKIISIFSYLSKSALGGFILQINHINLYTSHEVANILLNGKDNICDIKGYGIYLPLVDSQGVTSQ